MAKLMCKPHSTMIYISFTINNNLHILIGGALF